MADRSERIVDGFYFEDGDILREARKEEEGVRYIYTGPYGLEDTDELLLCLPDKPASELSEDALRAPSDRAGWKPTEAGTLGEYMLYNPAQDLVFSGVFRGEVT